MWSAQHDLLSMSTTESQAHSGPPDIPGLSSAALTHSCESSPGDPELKNSGSEKNPARWNNSNAHALQEAVIPTYSS